MLSSIGRSATLLKHLRIIPSSKPMLQHSHVTVTDHRTCTKVLSDFSLFPMDILSHNRIIGDWNDPASFLSDWQLREKRQPPLTLSISHRITRQGPNLVGSNLERTNEDGRRLHPAPPGD